MIDDGYAEKHSGNFEQKVKLSTAFLLLDSEIKAFINIRILKEHRRCEQSVYLQYQK